jgi:nitric oxide reductase NorQ protein
MSDPYKIEHKPYYLPIRDELEIFQKAWLEKVPVLLKGPTGCGKTRFIEYMAWFLAEKVGKTRAQPNSIGSLYTVSCHEDLTARDLIGRYIMKGGEAVWVDGPATSAVRVGGILYLDEIVEARKDVAVVIHPLTDHRRVLPIDTLGEVLAAPESFMVVASYNPGYQSVRKNLKPSTKQRFIAIDFDYPPADKERAIVASEGGVSEAVAEKFVLLANDVRNIATIDLEEGVSTRALVHAARLVKRGMTARRAASLAIAQAVSDETEEIAAVEVIIGNIFQS